MGKELVLGPLESEEEAGPTPEEARLLKKKVCTGAEAVRALVGVVARCARVTLDGG